MPTYSWTNWCTYATHVGGSVFNYATVIKALNVNLVWISININNLDKLLFSGYAWFSSKAEHWKVIFTLTCVN